MTKKRAIFTIIAGSIAVLLLSGVLLVGLKNNGFGFLRASAHSGGRQPFGHDRTIDIDSAEDPIEQLEISWEAGPVQVVVGTSDKIQITETSSRVLSDEEHMKVLVKDKKLQISWDNNRFRFLPLPFFATEEKALRVELPAATAQALSQADCSNVSGDMELDGLTIGEGELSSVSGSLHLAGVTINGSCNLNTTSGAITAQKLSAQSLDVNTTSGTLYFEDTQAESVNCSSISGEITFVGRAEAFSTNTVSGQSYASLSTCPKEVDMDSVSGALTLEVPKGSSFTAHHDSISGDFSTDFPTPGGKDHDVYGTGTPTGDFSFSTTSGSIMVMQQ